MTWEVNTESSNEIKLVWFQNIKFKIFLGQSFVSAGGQTQWRISNSDWNYLIETHWIHCSRLVFPEGSADPRRIKKECSSQWTIQTSFFVS